MAMGGFSPGLILIYRRILEVWQGRVHGMTVEATLGMLTKSSEGFSFQILVVFVVEYISLFQNLLLVKLFMGGVKLGFRTRRIWVFP